MEQLLRLARAKAIEWLSSDWLRTEVANNPDVERKDEAEVLLSLATETLSLDGAILFSVPRCLKLLAMGPSMPSISGSADARLTTDDRFTQFNPVEWLRDSVV